MVVETFGFLAEAPKFLLLAQLQYLHYYVHTQQSRPQSYQYGTREKIGNSCGVVVVT